MDRVNQLRGDVVASRESTLNASSLTGDAYSTADEGSKYFSLSEVDSSTTESPPKGPDANDDSVSEAERIISNLSPIPKKGELDGFKIGQRIEAANILSGGVNIFDDNENSCDEDELVIDDAVQESDEKPAQMKLDDTEDTFEKGDQLGDNVVYTEAVCLSKDTGVMLLIDGKNVDAIAIGNGLYLYRNQGEEELAAIQILDNSKQHSDCKFLKVRENAEGNLEVYEEIEVEVQKEVPIKPGKTVKNACRVPEKIKDKVSEHESQRVTEKISQLKPKLTTTVNESNLVLNKDDTQVDPKTEVNFNGKMIKFSESRKSPLVGTFTPMTYHSTPNKEGIPLTKTMVDLQLHPNRHSENVKKTIEVHTDNCKQRILETPIKSTNHKESSECDVKNDKTEKSDVRKHSQLKTARDDVLLQSTGSTEKDLHEGSKPAELKQTVNEMKDKHKIHENCTKTVDEKIEGTKFNTNDTKVTDVPKEETNALMDSKQESSTEITQNKSVDDIKDSINNVAVNSSHEDSSKTQYSTCSKPTDQLEKAIENSHNDVDVKVDIEKEQKNIPENRSVISPTIEYFSEQQNITQNVIKPLEVLDSSATVGNNTFKDGNLSIHISDGKSCDAKIKTNLENETTIDTKPVKDESITTLSNLSKVLETKNDTSVKKHDVPLNISRTLPKEENLKPISDLKQSSNESKVIKEVRANKSEIKQVPDLLEKVNPLPSSDLKAPNRNQASVESKKDLGKESKLPMPKPINNNIDEVPFGQWTDANRQEFLNKLKESKIPTNASNSKQLKQPNDLNRRDVLQKIANQRHSNLISAKVQELNALNKSRAKNDTPAFLNKVNVTQKEMNKDNKVSPSTHKVADTVPKVQIEMKIGEVKKIDKEIPQQVIPVCSSTTSLNSKKDPVHRKEINNQDLIDKTIEGIINRAVTAKLGQDDVKQNVEHADKALNPNSYPVSLDEIESKMNELHGIPFVERPPHELPQVVPENHENKTFAIADTPVSSKPSIVADKIPFTNIHEEKNDEPANQVISRTNEESDEEIIEHEPITGDIELNLKNALAPPLKDKKLPQTSTTTKPNIDSKKEPIITEKEFDKFARRNSITYENRLTVNFDSKEHHNVIQTVVEKEVVPKKLSRNEIMLAESKAKSYKNLALRHNFPSKTSTTVKLTNDEDLCNRNYQSKVQIAYQSAMTAKKQQGSPITIIEDKPVKVVFMDTNQEVSPHQLNVQDKELSPPKKTVTEWDHFTHSNSESLDSDTIDAGYDSKSQDDTKFKSKHQRKQVLTPVEVPELELIEPRDLGIEASPKKKRKVEDSKTEKNAKTLVPKKTYLLNRNIIVDDTAPKPKEVTDTVIALEDQPANAPDLFVKRSDAISAIDNLVKAAELLETQSENKHVLPPNDQNSPNNQMTPVKRGRGRPRKYPLPQVDNKSPSPVKKPTPQKKPRLIDAKIAKYETDSEDDEVDSNGELVKENWTMGKINENIVCPICNKLFRSENVVFKHVKHCTGPSPNRSDSDKRSPRRMRHSQELDWKSEGSKSDSMDVDDDYEENKPTKKRKSKERKSIDDKPEVIIIEDTPPVKLQEVTTIKKRDKVKQELNRTTIKSKIPNRITSNLVCESCGKTFRQLSYLVNHRLQHKEAETKKIEKDQVHKPLFSCEICKKEFRKLHHLVQHRIIHNPNPMNSRSSIKSSSEQSDTKSIKDASKPNEDQSAGFRCEPCDKSFRKLHHLVEHRETHDEINKKNITVADITDSTKPNALHHCDVCKKTFKKLEHLIEHKEHHLDTCSEKSDDKSVKSSLSTKDIIHECPLCYMVFPNEHSLTKHNIICQRKKKQSAAKQAKQKTENNTDIIDDEATVIEADEDNASVEEIIYTDTVLVEDVTPIVHNEQEDTKDVVEKPIEKELQIQADENNKEITKVEPDIPIVKTQIPEIEHLQDKDVDKRPIDKVIVKSKKRTIPMSTHVKIPKVTDTQTTKKKLLGKDKIGAMVTKKQKMANVTLPTLKEVKNDEASDEDEIRYMLNPEMQVDETVEEKLFIKVRAKKRSSLQFERPSSNDLTTRRISLQHPPKIPRPKVKPIPRKSVAATNTAVKGLRKVSIPVEAKASATDSDDSDVKYSFPESVKKAMEKEEQKKVKRQTIAEKRKSLTNIAKRKSMGIAPSAKHKANPSPAKQIKRRTLGVEHRCDCGQLFSSAALLARHATLAHTPPRRRRRSPPPEPPKPPNPPNPPKHPKQPQVHPGPAKKSTKAQPEPPKAGVTTRKSSVPSPRAGSRKLWKCGFHSGVPLPDKLAKAISKTKK